MSPRQIHFVSLGCPKNRVDSEVMLGVAEAEGYTHCDDPGDAEVVVVNTCGFIDAAKEESIETILELGRLKQDGRCRKLIVTGCLSRIGRGLAGGGLLLGLERHVEATSRVARCGAPSFGG